MLKVPKPLVNFIPYFIIDKLGHYSKNVRIAYSPTGLGEAWHYRDMKFQYFPIAATVLSK